MDQLRFSQSALVVVDVQQGFSKLCPDELPIPGALEIVPAINQLLDLPWLRIDASQDWHPPDHCSFLGQDQHLYPPHCVQNTLGAEFLPGLLTERFETIWRKGFNQDFEAYALTAEHEHYSAFLHACGVKTVVICGLALNICCFFLARDLHQAGFEVLLVEDASAGIDIPQADLFQDKTKSEGQSMGLHYTTVDAILKSAKP